MCRNITISLNQAQVVMYAGGTFVLSGKVSGAIRDTIYILGQNSSGKSTTLKALAYIFKFQMDPVKDVSNVDTSRGVSIAGVDINSARVAFINQNPLENFDPSPLSDNVRDFLRRSATNPETEIESVIELIQGELGLSSEDLTRDPKTFSSGEQQKIALALRAISKPEIIFLDEPFARLSQRSTSEISRVLRRFASDSYRIFATHPNDMRLMDEKNMKIFSVEKDNYNINVIERDTPEKRTPEHGWDMKSKFIQEYINLSDWEDLCERTNDLTELPERNVIFVRGNGDEVINDGQNVKIFRGNSVLTHASVRLTSGINLVIGDNGSGKTLFGRAVFGSIRRRSVLESAMRYHVRWMHYDSDTKIIQKKGFNKYRFLIPSEPVLFSERTLRQERGLTTGSGKELIDSVCQMLGVNIEEEISNLSYGAQKAIQFALAPENANVVVLDEPFGSLAEDLQNLIARRIVSRVKDRSWKTVLVTSNRPKETVESFERSLVEDV